MNPFSSALAPVSPGFFIYGEKAFDRSVLDIIGREDSQFGGYTDAIVGTQSRTVGAKPVSVDDCFDRIMVEIMCGSIILFADHVHVGLQNDCRRFSLPGVAGLDIRMLPTASFLIAILYCLANDSRNSIIFPSFFEGRGTLCYLVEELPDDFRL